MISIGLLQLSRIVSTASNARCRLFLYVAWSVCLSVCLSVCVLVTRVSCAKTAEPIEMPFDSKLPSRGVTHVKRVLDEDTHERQRHLVNTTVYDPCLPAMRPVGVATITVIIG